MNAVHGEDITHQLLQQDHNYRALVERHHMLDDRLATLSQRHYLSQSEQLEESSIKKEKLALKDQMAHIVRQWSSTHPSSSQTS
jgi:uncharacterized protein YdcH (DUF465 family)